MAGSEPNRVGCEQQQATAIAPTEPLTDPATFVAPTTLTSPRVVIEFCNRVRAHKDCFETSVVIRSCSVDGELNEAKATIFTLKPKLRLHRAQWIATELFLTFPPPELASISVIPLTSDETAGRFRIWVITDSNPTLAWDRKVEGGFPELKVLVECLPQCCSKSAQLTIVSVSKQKQRIRDKIQPGKSLGHSDAGTRQ